MILTSNCWGGAGEEELQIVESKTKPLFGEAAALQDREGGRKRLLKTSAAVTKHWSSLEILYPRVKQPQRAKQVENPE